MKRASTVPTPRGRPRSFDRERALERAMLVFWRKGYEAASLSDLTRAMDINPPSLYAAFGDKERLYLEAIELYEKEHWQETARALDEPRSARQAVERLLLQGAADLTGGECSGCMLSNAHSADARLDAKLAERRALPKRLFKARFDRAVRERELARGTDTGALADFYTAVFQGMAAQARDGAPRKSLLATARAAMRAWPGARGAK